MNVGPQSLVFPSSQSTRGTVALTGSEEIHKDIGHMGKASQG